MKRYNMLQAVAMPFYSRDFYRDVARNWGAKAYLFLFLLAGLSSVLFTMHLQQVIIKNYHLHAEHYVNQVPELKIEDGIVKTPEARPYYIKDRHNTIMAVIDTTGKYTSPEQAHTSLLITSDQIITKPKENETNIKVIPKAASFTFSAQETNAFIERFIGYSYMLIFPFTILLFFLGRLIQVFAYSLIALVYARAINAPLNYGAILRLSIFALVPSIWVSLIANYFNFEVFHPWLFSFVLTLFYLFYAVKANSNVSQELQ